jgi:hypothetical protein
MTPSTEELNNPPFDPTPKEYTIRVRDSGLGCSDLGQNLDAAAWSPDSPSCEPEEGFLRSLFGPTKNDLRIEIGGLSRQIEGLLKNKSDLQKQNVALEKQCAVYTKTYLEVDTKLRICQMNLMSANEEIERLAMQPKRKPGRPKKAK